MNIQQFRKTISQEKNRKDSLWVRYVIRPVSFYVASFFKRLGFTANGVTYLSIIVVFLAFILFLLESRIFTIAGAVLVQIWMILDCVDGNLARVSKTKNPYGDAIDAMSGYTMYGFVFLGLGMVAERDSGWLNHYTPDYFFVLLGGIAAVCTLTARLVFQKFATTEYKLKASNRQLSNRPRRVVYFVDKNIGLSGFFMPAMLITVAFSFTQVLVVFYAIYYLAVLMFCYLRFILKVQRTNLT